MSKKLKKGILFISIFIVVFIITTLILLHKNNKEIDKKQFLLDKNLMNVQFKGKIINTKEIERDGRYHDIACLQLDYCNVDSFYLYIPNAAFLKIKNGRAVMPIPTGTSNGEIDYIEVNIEHSGKEKFYKNGKLIEEYRLSFSSAGLLEKDIGFCD